MLKVLYYLPPSVTLKYSHPPHFISCLLIWFSVTSYKTTFPDQICTALCVSLLITEADKLLHSQEMILQSALRQKCKSCQVGSILLWSVRWFLHYLHTTNRVLSLCGDQKGVLFDACVCVCGWMVFKAESTVQSPSGCLEQITSPSSKGAPLIIRHDDKRRKTKSSWKHISRFYCINVEEDDIALMRGITWEGEVIKT